MAFYQLVYTSSASEHFTKVELLDLLAQSRNRNEELGITGLLLYHGGNILQVLEGDESAVEKLFGRIAMDTRHRGIIVLFREFIEEREFAQWAMGFRDLEDGSLESLEGYDAMMNEPRWWNLPVEEAASNARLLINCFRQRLR